MRVPEVIAAIEAAGLTPMVSETEVYVVIDGPGSSPVESEWILAFARNGDEVTQFAIENRLVGP